LSSCNTLDTETKTSTGSADSWSSIQGNNVSPEEEKDLQTQESIQNKIETIRKRLALKGLIIDGDGYYREWQIALALVKYLEFYRKNPEDELILEKLWDAYFSLNKYTSSYSYYSKVQDPSEDVLDKTALSLLHETDFNDIVSVKSTQTKIATTFPKWEISYYYLKSLDCALDFHSCKLDLWEYFWPEKILDGENIVEPEIKFLKLADLKTAIENYRNFQVDQVYLKDAYIVASWYSNGLYAHSAHMWENILSYKPGYKPILKIVAQSYFELWAYEKARAVLWKYQEIDDEDPAVNYMLWIVHTQLKDYVLGNIHLSKAIKLGSPESLKIRRQLIHNFYQLNNQSNLLREFQSLIENEKQYTPEDLGLAIYNHILQWDYETSLWWSKLWIEKFPENAGNFYGYEAWILREKWELELADTLLKVWNKSFPDNPFILINLWYTALELDQKWAAISHFKTILKNYPNTEFSISAQKELDTLSKK
jgi:hypothetical protein